MAKRRLMSGMRPTGKLHLGHLLGALNNWRKLQQEYECYFMVADWHALTTGYRKTEEIPESIRDMVLDWLAVGIDPEHSTIYLQSHVPEIAELHLLLSMVVPVAWMERVPSYKDQIQELGQDIATYGFLGYPLLQTCDILAMKGELVPVGQDQLPHLEFGRELVRRFHFIVGKEIFPEPQAYLSEAPFVPGVDGRKMSKSYGNGIFISDPPEEIREKVKQTITDPQKIHKNDPGRPEVCNIFFYHKFFSPEAVTRQVDKDCRSGALGCVADKNHLADILIEHLKPIRERRAEFLKDEKKWREILHEGAKKARKTAQQTLTQVREAMHLTPPLS